MLTAYESWSDPDSLVSPEVCIRTSTGKIICSADPDELLEFLRFSSSGLRLVGDIDVFMAPILRLLPLPLLQQLVDLSPTAAYGRHTLFYSRDRMASVGLARFYGIRQFLNKVGVYSPTLEEVEATGAEILDACAGIGLGTPRKLTTSIAMLLESDACRGMLQAIPRSRDLPSSVLDDVVQLSTLADNKYWVANHAIGRWLEGESWDYDLTACFSSAASKLLDVRDLEFWRSDRLGRREQGAYYGLLRGSFHLDSSAEYAPCSPIIAALPNGLRGNPVGHLPPDVYSLEEVRTVEQYGLGTFHMESGIFASPMHDVRPRQPFKAIMEWLYERRQWSSMAAALCKSAANGLVGKMIERRVRPTSAETYDNEFYHALITSQTRCEITKFLIENAVKPDELLVVQTDGVRLTRHIPLRNGHLGSWRCNGSQPVIILSGRRVYCDDKRPFMVTYSDIVRMVAEHPRVARYSKTEPHRTTLAEALDAGDISKVGETQDMTVDFDLVGLAMEQTHWFPKLPRTGVELLGGHFGSEPVILTGLDKG